MAPLILVYPFPTQAEDSIGDSSVSGVQTCVFFFQAEDGIRDSSVTGVQTCAFPIQAEDGIRDSSVTGVQTCALPIYLGRWISAISESQVRAPSEMFAIADSRVRLQVTEGWLGVDVMVCYQTPLLDAEEIGRASCRERV